MRRYTTTGVTYSQARDRYTVPLRDGVAVARGADVRTALGWKAPLNGVHLREVILRYRLDE